MNPGWCSRATEFLSFEIEQHESPTVLAVQAATTMASILNLALPSSANNDHCVSTKPTADRRTFPSTFHLIAHEAAADCWAGGELSTMSALTPTAYAVSASVTMMTKTAARICVCQ
ncbi:hypothetical protein CGRA01v4_00488 [Colletotrichum graminicola]|nr:hypothetical protein CGRA01v4_00488 [Colletotrichum graminicola]